MCSGNDYRCIGILGATTGFFCLTTILLAIAVIILLLKYCRRGGIANNAHRASISTGVKGKGKANPSYWITDYDLGSPKISASTPNLSEWAGSPPLNTFFSAPPPLQKVNHDQESEYGGSGGMVVSASMAPVTPGLSERTERRLRKSMSFCDLKAYKESLESSKKRREPPSPPTLERPNSVWHTPAPAIPKSIGALSPPSQSKPMPVPRKKKHISVLLEEKQESQLNEYEEGMELESANIIPTATSVLSGLSTASVSTSVSGSSGPMIGSALVNAAISGAANETRAVSTPLYEKINKVSLNEPSEYETIEDFLGPLQR